MNIILNILNWFSQNILQNPAFFVGLLVLVGYALLKKPAHDVYAGFIKATVGYMLLNVGAGGLVTTFRPILAALNFKFKIGAAVIDPYFGLTAANTKIATVDANGSVTAKAPGRTKITVTSSENSSYQASCTVTVPYKITYKLNKGKNNASNPSTYYGKKVTLKNPSRKGYAFAGWYTDAKFKKKITSISSSAKSEYVLYAKWTKVKVAKASLTSAKNSKSKQILLKYKKVSGAKGYEISYSTDKKFKKVVTKKNTAKTSYTISKLKKGKIYYVRIRAYKMDSTGKKVYGKYSSMKKVKVSKQKNLKCVTVRK